MLVCPKCHLSVSAGALACANCGTAFEPPVAHRDQGGGVEAPVAPGLWSRIPEPWRLVIAAACLALGVPAITLLSVWVFPIAWVVCFAVGLGLGSVLPKRPRIPVALPASILAFTVASFGVVQFGDFRFGRDWELLVLIGLTSINLSLVLFGVISRRKTNAGLTSPEFLSLCTASVALIFFGLGGFGLAAALLMVALVNTRRLILASRRLRSGPRQD